MQNKPCTSCDQESPASDLLKSTLSFNIHHQNFDIDIYFCRQCANYVLENFADQINAPQPTLTPLSPSEKKDKKNPVNARNCSFCNLAAEQCKIMLQFCQFFFTPKDKKLHIVKHDRLFLSTHQDQNPELIGRGFICDRCVSKGG